MLMRPENRQIVLLAGFMVLLTVTTLFLFVYAPNPLEVVGLNLPSLGQILDFVLEKFNLFNYY